MSIELYNMHDAARSLAALHQDLDEFIQAGLEAFNEPNSSIKSVFDYYCKLTRWDTKKTDQIRAFDVSYATKNIDHISFLGSGLLGVYPLKWLDQDRDRWVDDILEIDDIALKEDIDNLPTVEASHKVSSDIINLSFVYVIHRLLQTGKGSPSALIPEKARLEAMESVIRIMHYKYISSILSHYFPYPADESIAKATYASLNLRFDIKRYGNWGALITARARDILSKSSIHYGTFVSGEPDHKFQYVVTDVQTRIRKVLILQTGEFYKQRDADGRVINTSRILQVDGGTIIKSVHLEAPEYQRYISSIIVDINEFMKPELIKLTTDVVNSASENLFKNTLVYISANYDDKRKKEIRELVTNMIIYALQFMQSKGLRSGDLANIIYKLRAMLTGSRINDPDILSLRKMGDSIVSAATRRKPALCAPERTAVLLYIVLRTLTKNKF